MDRFERDRRMEPDRLLAAWLRHMSISQNEPLDASQAEINDMRRRAAASGVLIPRTEPGYLYHGTARSRIKSISLSGLIPDQKSVWTGDGFALHAKGRVFFCDTVSKASFYAREASRARPVILRILHDRLADRLEDHRESGGCSFVQRGVAADDLQIWSPKLGWAALPVQEMLREPVQCDEVRVDADCADGPA